MDVKCSNCGTEYNLDETLVSSKGTSVRCTKCSSVFKVYPEKSVDSENDTWILRKAGGKETPFSRMYVLQRWITEGKATPSDFLSRGGEDWKRLSDIPELKSFFSAASAKRVSRAGVAQKAPAAQSHQQIPQDSKKGSKNKARPQSADIGKPVPMAKAVETSKSLPKNSPIATKNAPETLPPPANPRASQPNLAAPAESAPAAERSLFDAANTSSGKAPSLKDWQAGAFETAQSSGVDKTPNISVGGDRVGGQSGSAAGLPSSGWEPDLKETATAGNSRGGPIIGDSLLEPPAAEQSVAFSLQTLAASLAPGSPVSGVEVSVPVVSPNPSPQRAVQQTPPPQVAAGSPSSQYAEGSGNMAEKPPIANPAEASGLDFSQIPASDEDKGWNAGAAVGDVADPAWAEKSGAVPRYVEEDDALPPPRRKWGPLVAVILILAVIVGGIYVLTFKRSAVDSLFSSLISSKEIGRYKKFYDRGRENFLLDSESYFRQADREYQKVLALEEDHPTTLAALGEMYAVWAQYLRDAKMEAMGDAKGEDSSEAMNREIDRLNDQYEQKLAEALRWIEQAKIVEEVPAEVHRVSADIKRLQGDIEGATKDLHKARAMGADPETDYVASMLDLENGKPAEEVETVLGRIIETKPLIRAMYRRARLLASSEKVAEAKEVLGKIFELNSDHTRAQDLAARIDDGKPIPLLEIASEAAGQDSDRASEGQKAVAAESEVSASPDAPVASPKEDEKAAEKTPGANLSNPQGGDESSRAQQGRGGGRTDSMLGQATRMQKSGKTAAAMKLFEAILSKEPNNLDALCGLGDAYLDKGAFGRAIANYRRALRVNSSFGPALLGLAEAFKSLTQNEQAVKYYESYLRSHPNGRQAGLARRRVEQLRGSQKAEEPEGEGHKEAAEKTGEAGKPEKSPEENRNTPAATTPANDKKGAAGEGSEESEE